jgi:hypothetical protein
MATTKDAKRTPSGRVVLPGGVFGQVLINQKELRESLKKVRFWLKKAPKLK